MRQYKNSVQTTRNTVNKSTHITKTPTQLSKHPHIHKSTHYKTHTYAHPNITKYVKTTTLPDTHQKKIHITIKYPQYKVTLMCMVLLSPRTPP